MNSTVPSLGFGEAIKLFFSNYSNFNGRARRSEYWWSSLAKTIIFIFGLAIFFVPLVGFIAAIAFLIPCLSQQVRRLHDIGRSGWWSLIVLIPVVGLILLFVWCLQDSGPDNQWGPNPKGLSAPADQQAYSPVHNAAPAYNNPTPAPSYVPVQTQGLLKVQSGPMAGRHFPLEEGKVVTVGRDPNRCDIVLTGYPRVSGAHCRIQYKMGTVNLVDTNSANGTFVNGVRQAPGQPVSVPSPATIQLGGSGCTIVI